MRCAALSNLLCRSTSIVLIKPFQTSFFLQPAHQEASCAALSTINWYGFAEEAGYTIPFIWPSPARVAIILSVAMALEAIHCLPLFPFSYTQHIITTTFGKWSTGSKFVRAQNCVTDSELSSASWLAAWLPAGARSAGWLPPVELACLPHCVWFLRYSVRPLFVNCSFLFHEERNKIRRRNWSDSLIPFLIVWTQIKSLNSLSAPPSPPFLFLLSSGGIEWIKFHLEELK